MKHLSLFKAYQYRIKLNSINDKVTLWFFGDVHRDLPNCDVDRWRWFLKKSKEDPNWDNTYYIGMGDTHDFASAKEGKALKTVGLHEQTYDAISEIVIKRNRAFAMEIKQMRGKLIGLVGGNHTWVFDNGMTSDEDLANRMGAEYLGWVAYVEIVLDYKTGNSRSFPMVVCHGTGGGRVLGSSVRKVEDLFHIFPGALIYAMGHDHKRGAWPESRIVAVPDTKGGIKLKQERQFYCRTGSFMRSYCVGESSYPVGKLMRPADLGALRLDLSCHRDRTNEGDAWIKDIEATI